MKHRDRVLAVLHHETPDRCPMQISFTPEFAERLAADLRAEADVAEAGLRPSRGARSGDRPQQEEGDRLQQVHNPHGGGNTYELERALGEDMLLTSVGWANSYYQEGYEKGGAYTDEWGITWQSVPYSTPYGVGHYTETVARPLADDAAIESYRPPDPHRPELYRDAEWTIQTFKDEYWIVGVTVTTIFETAWALRGYDRLMMDFVTDPVLAERILEIPFRYHLTAARKLTELGVDMIWIGDDVGAQRAMLISPRHWRHFLKPRLAEFIAEIKTINPQLKVAYHSDGTIYPIIPELIEIGVDVLNPIQPACMDPARLKKEYGDRLCFWGTIDEQHTLPFGTPADVAAEVRARLETIGQGGGLIIGPTHHVQLDTPMENFWTMINAIAGGPLCPHYSKSNASPKSTKTARAR
jgi:uroporphyrinogen decarboxylase